MDHQEIHQIRQQHLAGQWPKFLESVTISGLRGWTGQTLRLNFPIVAIVGENGSGKSTFLKSAASAYEHEGAQHRTYPSDFFRETHWDKFNNVSLGFAVRQGNTTQNLEIKKPAKKWKLPARPSRHVFLFDISRTLPLDATAGYARIAQLAATEVATNNLDDTYRDRLSHVLGREYTKARFAKSDVDTKREVGLLTRTFGEISQFHQGAGEDATLDLMKSLQQVPNTSLVIIDEVEASLHPRAQRRMIRFLLWFCRQKRVQLILSTHSPYILEELPPEARVLLLPGTAGSNIVYGATPEFALSRLDEALHPEVHLFVEDREAATLLDQIILAHPRGPELVSRTKTAVVGPANVVSLLGQLSIDARLPYKSLSFLDGDQSATPGCILLPGMQAPERQVYSDLKAKAWPNIPERFGLGAGELLANLEDSMLEPDHHKWNTLVGDRTRKSKISVWEILVQEWVRACLNSADRDRIAQAIIDKLSA